MIGNVSRVYAQKDQASAIAYVPFKGVDSDKVKSNSSPQETKKDTYQSTRVTISEEALQKLGLSQTSKTQTTSDQSTLSAEEMNQISDLKSRDREVRAHEMAHMMVGGNLVRKGGQLSISNWTRRLALCGRG